jgi:hypothetical protein
MLWSVCHLENLMHCRFSEAVFLDLLWWFRTASNTDLIRLKKADFMHFGIIPQGIEMVKSQDRYTPDVNLVSAGFSRLKTLMAENSSAFTQDFDKGANAKEQTATEVMARVNSVNALVSGMLTLAYEYEQFKDRETMRRLCIKGNPDPLAQKFYKLCMLDKVPPEMLDIDRMMVSRERTLGAGNKTLEMAIVQFLQQIRKNLGPDAQRRVDHLAIETATDDANLAEDLAPLDGQQALSSSMNNAELSTDRLMRGLPYDAGSDAVAEDYVKVWLYDLAMLVEKAVEAGNMATADQIAGFQNMAKHIEGFLKNMSSNEDDVPHVKQYQGHLKDLMNHVKAFAQRLEQQAKAAAKNGQGGLDAKAIGRIQSDTIIAQNKAKLGTERSAQRMAMDAVKFEQKQAQSEREHKAEIRRMSTEHYFEMLTGLTKDLSKPRQSTNGEKPDGE